MAGFQNTIVFSQGERLQPSTSTDISNMQEQTTDVSRINYTGNPEGNVSANPSSLCHDPISGNVYFKQSGNGNTGWELIGFSPLTEISSVVSNISLTNGTTANLTSITLTPGIYEMTAIGYCVNSMSLLGSMMVGISSASQTFQGTVGDQSVNYSGAATIENLTLTIPNFRVTVGSTTTYYLVIVVNSSGGLGTFTANGRLSALQVG